MTRRLQLSELAAIVQETIEDRFYNDSFWITAEITDVKKYESKRWCFLKFIEKIGSHVATEMQAVFWANAYQQIILFEKITRQTFKDGIEISCRVAIKFHPRYGLKLEVLEIDTSFALGKLELERQQTLDRLLKENPHNIQLIDDEYISFNNQLKLPAVVQNIALITAPNSDGQRDFINELSHNPHGYRFKVHAFLTQLQGDTASGLLVEQLRNLFYRSSDFDVLVIVRGGGSQTDLKPFDDYELAKQIALFPIPVFTGIGHDRNTSIADLMARQFKTPTKVAAAIIDINFRFDSELQQLHARLEDAVESLLYDKRLQLSRWHEKIQLIIPQKLRAKQQRLQDWKLQLERDVIRMLSYKKEGLAKEQEKLQRHTTRFVQMQQQKLETTTRLLHQLSPATVLQRGFAVLMQDEKIITDANQLATNKNIKTILYNSAVESSIISIQKDEPANI
jgi:exodeoxyribonuclease VII large subunit